MNAVKDLQERLRNGVTTEGGVAEQDRPAAAGASASRVDQLAQAICRLARHYGSSISVEAVKAGLPMVGGRLPFEYAADAARAAGLEADASNVEVARLDDASFPVLVRTREGEIVVVWSVDRDEKGNVTSANIGEAPGFEPLQKWQAGQLTAIISNVVRLRPAEANDQRISASEINPERDWFLPAFSASRRIYSEAIAATLAINVLALALPLFTMNVYDRVLPNAAVETLWSLAIGVMLAVVFDFALRMLRGHIVDVAGRRADVILGNFLYGRLIGARLEGPVPSAGVRANTMRELDTLREFYNSATLAAFGDLPFVVLFLAVIWLVAGWLVLIPLAVIPLLLAIGWLTQKAIGRLMEASMRQSSIRNAVIVETVSGIETIKAACAESWAATAWEKATAESIRVGNRIRQCTNCGLFTVHALQTLTQVAVVVGGFYLIAAGSMTMGALIAATILTGRVMQPLAQIATLIAKLHQARLAYRLLSEIAQAPQEREAGAALVKNADITGRVEFENVSFRYQKDSPAVLQDVSFTIAPGEKIGLIGGIGTGKSTVLRLLHGLKRPDNGRVLIDRLPVTQYDPAILRSQVALALQHGDLFHGSIRSNITLANPGIEDADLLQAARVAGALDWIVKCPKGFDTPVFERGAGLSGGQRQTILLARALLLRPRILLLDEPTSDLDPATEQIVIERLRTFLEGRTAIIVTHRPAMLTLVDRLIVLDNGRKRLDGPKAAVLSSLAAAVRRSKAKAEAAKP